MTGGAGLITSIGGGGGSGDILSTLAIANQLEKQGIKTAIPNGDVMIESFTEIEGEILLYSDYTGGTQIVLKNKVGLMTGYTMPFIIQDSTGNNEVVLISSFVSGSSGAWTYNIAAALSNNYTTANSSKIKNYFGDVSGNQLTAASTRTFSQFVKTLLLRRAKAGGTLQVGLDFFGNVFPADVSLLSTNILKFTSATDVKGNFKDDDYVMIFKKTPDEDADTIVLSKQNPQGTGAYSWFIVQLSADSSYSSPTITAAFDNVYDPVTGTFSAGFPNIGADETNYFVIRLSAFLDYLAGSKTATTFTQAVPSEVIVKSGTQKEITDDFNRTNTSAPTLGGEWIHTYVAGNAGYAASISSNRLALLADYTNTNKSYYTHNDTIDIRGDGYTEILFQKVGHADNSANQTTKLYFSFGSAGIDTAQEAYVTDGVSVGLQISGAGTSTAYVYQNNVNCGTLGCGSKTNTFNIEFRIFANGGYVEMRTWALTGTRPDSATVVNINKNLITGKNIIMSVYIGTHNALVQDFFDNLSIKKYSAGYTLKYNIPLTGTINKVSLIGGTSVQTAGLSDSILSCNAAVV